MERVGGAFLGALVVVYINRVWAGGVPVWGELMRGCRKVQKGPWLTMHHHAGFLNGKRSTIADTIRCYLSLLLSCCSLLCLEDEVALRVCISFDP